MRPINQDVQDMEFLEDQLSHLKTAESVDLPKTQDDIHQYITIYTVKAVLVFCSIVYYFRNKMHCLKNNPTPTPNPLEQQNKFELRVDAGKC